MSTEENLKIVLTKIAPPTDKKFEIKYKLSLVPEIAWFLILLVLHIPLAIFKVIFPPEGKSLKGKIVLVTGAGRGLGRGLAHGFSREGCKIAVVDINYENALQTASEISASGGAAKAYQCNVAKVAEVKALQEAVTRDLGPVDILVNNAGIIYGGQSLVKSSKEDIRTVMDVNLLSHFWMMQEFLPGMKARNSGHIVAIASMSSFVGAAGGSAYIASKFGVRGLMEVIREELESRANNNIKTSMVCPYFINTSADYIQHWDIRFPPVSIQQVVESTVAGVKRDQFYIIVPAFMEPILHSVRLLPLSLIDKLRKIVFGKMIPLNYEKISINNSAPTKSTTCVSNGVSKQDKSNK